MTEAYEFKGVHNFRAVAPYALRGGGRMRANKVFRSGALERMTAEDEAWLRATDVRTILDLRHGDEVAMSVTHPLADRVVSLSIFPQATTQDALIAELNGLYGPGPSPRRYLHYLDVGGAQFARAFELFATEESYPVLVHCTAGKDRTGVLLGMVMDVLGADPGDIAEEYGLSDASIPALIAYLEATGRKLQGTPEEIYQRLATPASHMAGFIELLHEKHGGAEAFFRSQGVSDEAIARVREHLAE